MADIDSEIAAIRAEIDSIKAMPEQFMTPAPTAPAPTQLMSLANQPTRAPTEIELGVAQLRAQSPLEQAMANVYGRKLLAQEAYSLGTFPKIEAAAEAGKGLLFGLNPIEQFAQETQRQDILKEYVKQKDLEANQLILGMTGPELGGALLSPVGRLYTPTKVAAGAGLTSAFATRAANVAKAAGTTGGAAALQTFLSQPGTLAERTAAAGEVAGPAALLGGEFAGAAEVISAAGPKLIELGKSGRRAAIGAKLGDYKKGVGKRQIDIDPTTGARSLTEKGLDNVIEKGYLGESLNPRLQQVNLENNIGRLETELDAAISKVEAQGVKTPAPTFQKIKDKIKSGKGYTVREQDKYLAEIADIENKLNQRGAEKLSYLQEQKKAFGATYDPKSNSSDAMFNRDVYHALQAEVEKYVPQAKQINEEVQGLILTRPIIAGRVAEESNKFLALVNRISKAGFTTGGVFGAGATALLGPVGGLAVGTLGAALTSKPVQDVIAQGLTRPQDIAKALGRIGLQAGAVQRPEIQAMFPESKTEPETANNTDREIELLKAEIAALKAETPVDTTLKNPSTSTEKVKVGKQNISIPTGEEYSKPRLVKAVIAAESAFNPNAVSPKGAGGLMQIMPATAKDLGLTKEQRFDPDKNVEAGSRYLKQLENQFGDEKVALAAYNWGMGNVSNAAKKLKAEGEPVTWENIKSIVKVPSETRQYVDRVMLLRKYDDFDLAKIAAHPKVGKAKLDKILAKYKTGKKFTVGDILDELGLDAKDVRVKRSNVLQSASDLTEA
jgi:hypothetical protein